jgi:uncharacterized membrane protein
MNSLFWERAHGGLTHLPIALIFAAAFFDALAFFYRHSPRRNEFKAIGYWLVIFGALGTFGAVFSGLALSKWTIGGTGTVLRHHLFVWPAFALIVGLATWRFLVGRDPSQRASALYLVTMVVGCAFVGAAGFFGGEILLGQ